MWHHFLKEVRIPPRFSSFAANSTTYCGGGCLERLYFVAENTRATEVVDSKGRVQRHRPSATSNSGPARTTTRVCGVVARAALLLRPA